MARQRLGPWGRWYASTEEDTAHYTDAQFRAWAGVFGRAVANRGELPKLKPLRALYASGAIDFLIEEGRLDVTADNAVTVRGWMVYQAPVDNTNAIRQARHRSRTKTSSVDVDNALGNGSNAVTVTGHPTSTSIESTKDEGRVESGASYPVAGSEPDGLDAYYEITGSRPWGRPIATWLLELEATHGLANLRAALEVEVRAGDRKKLVDRVAARLEAQAHRVEQAEAKKPKPVDPLIVEQRAAYAARYGPEEAEVAAEPDPATVAAGRAAFEALRGSLGGRRNGASASIGDVLRSRPGAEAARQKLSLTVDEGSDTQSAAVDPPGSENDGQPSPAVRDAAVDRVEDSGSPEAPR